MPTFGLDGQSPEQQPGAWVAPTAVLVGEVHLAEQVSVWYGCVLRADHERIRVGPRSNLQDGTIVHADPDLPVLLGAGVTVGHRALLHGCRVDDDVLVGMGAVLLNGVRVGSGSVIAAGAVLREGTEVPPNSLVAGVPARVRRDTTAAERAHIADNAADYLRLAARHAAATGRAAGAGDRGR